MKINSTLHIKFITLLIFIATESINFSYAQTILIKENFDNNKFDSRGWYDNPKGTISSTEHINNSSSCFECIFLKGQKTCKEGTPSRHLFNSTDELYVSYWVKYSKNWEGSNKPYHPHEFNIMTNADDIYVGPAITHLTMYIEQNEGRPLLALQDSKNVDQNCILLNNNNFIGCNGEINKYQFNENRSVAACNGIVGDYDRRDCFFYGSGYYYSARIWDCDSIYFSDNVGEHYKNDWHHVEAYFKMNSISNGKGIPNGKLSYWYDSKLLLKFDNILMRTAQFPEMKFNQFLIAPYIGDGSPVEQTMWIDDLNVATSQVKTTDIIVENASNAHVLPIPASDYINVVSLKGKGEILNQFGIIVWKGILDDEQRIDVSRFPSGFYFIKSTNKNCKFVIVK